MHRDRPAITPPPADDRASFGALGGARRDTVMVPGNGGVIVALDADNPGRRAFHFHKLYHVEAGMMTEFR